MDGELILPDGKLLDVFGQASHHPGTVTMQIVGLALILVGRVDDRGLENSDMIARCLSHVLHVLWHCDILSSGGRQATKSLAAAERL